jgi:DNA primase
MLTRIDTDLVRHDHPIGDVVTSYGVELRPVGRALVGRCPLHADGGRPNLHVYPDNQSWYCYRCTVGGDVISFVMRVERLNFRSAVARLGSAASRPGIVRARPAHVPKPRRPRGHPWGQAERACLAAAVELYHNRLLGEPAALEYIEGRGIERPTAERCHLGYVSGDELANYLRWRRLPPQAAMRAGLLGRDGRELLTGRVVVPEIRAGQPRWLVGRILADDAERPKYLGLRGSKPLFGWEAAARSATAVLVEGVFDWLTLVQWGFPALALVGTRARPDVLRALDTRFRRLYLALDADEAGQEAAAAIEEALGPQAVRVRLPAGVKDVAELASRPNGRASFAGALRQAQTAPAPLVRAA